LLSSSLPRDHNSKDAAKNRRALRVTNKNQAYFFGRDSGGTNPDTR
jgi:hypothetical protein